MTIWSHLDRVICAPALTNKRCCRRTWRFLMVTRQLCPRCPSMFLTRTTLRNMVVTSSRLTASEGNNMAISPLSSRFAELEERWEEINEVVNTIVATGDSIFDVDGEVERKVNAIVLLFK